MEMTELEKVIKGFKCCKRKDGNECKVCPYTESEYCVEDMVTDALAILKEQEAVEPIPYHRSDGTIFKYECRQCRTKIFKMDLFCRRCGRKVKWE